MNDPQSIKSTWSAYWKLYGSADLIHPYLTELQVIALGMKERLFRPKQANKNKYKMNRVQLRQNREAEENDKYRPLFKKLW